MVKGKAVLIAIAVIFIVGCGTWQKTTTLTYESMGAALITFEAESQRLCADGTFTPEKCEQIKIAYNNAIDMYWRLGSIAIKAIDSGDMKEYKKTRNSAAEILIELETLIREGK